jgi:Raf kinase inhibitor-like YbhB/YbcL family protein
MPLSILSPEFEDHAPIPTLYTCDGENVSPPLGWSGAPAGTTSFALIVDDPDAPDPAAPRRTYVHWVVYDLPPSVRELEAGASGGGRAALPDGAHEGKNDSGTTGYTGPCPPIGRHRYFFKLYALDTLLRGLRTPAKADVERAMEGHVLERAELVGTYQAGGRGG